jgi:hypothetical protein
LLGSLNQSLSPYINRFLSADTIVPGYANPQNLNRYSYVANNPLRYKDPSGHMLCQVCEGEGGDGYTPPKPPDPVEPPEPDDPSDDPANNPEPGLNEELEALMDYCVLHPYASSCSFALLPETCESGSVIGPPGTTYTPPGCQFAGFETYLDESQLDYGGLFFNGLGVAGGFAFLIGTLGVVSLPAGVAIYESTQIAGFAYDVYQLDTEAVTVDLVLEVAGQTNLGSQIVPGLGSLLDFLEMGEIWADAQVTVPVYEPYPRPLPVP